uniref:Protein kinase domain-containing protein n=1 Tax=Arcella intermedia TaxID=1963864 RepID=A0A6B2LJ99_9EUKA
MSKSTDIDEMSSILEEITIMEFIKGCDNVVRLMDVYETHDKIMLVLDLVVGGELFEKIVARGSYSEKDAAYALKQMMTALSQIHSKRIIHRDLKPENILCVHTSLTLPEEIKIADFGESIVLLPGEYTNELRGSPCYIAPEVWLNKDYDMCSDMWSMGVIAFILASPRKP